MLFCLRFFVVVVVVKNMNIISYYIQSTVQENSLLKFYL